CTLPVFAVIVTVPGSAMSIVVAMPLSDVIGSVSLSVPLEAEKFTGIPTTTFANASMTRAVTVAVPPLAPVATTALSSRRAGVPFSGNGVDGLVGVSAAQPTHTRAIATQNNRRFMGWVPTKCIGSGDGDHQRKSVQSWS